MPKFCHTGFFHGLETVLTCTSFLLGCNDPLSMPGLPGNHLLAGAVQDFVFFRQHNDGDCEFKWCTLHPINIHRHNEETGNRIYAIGLSFGRELYF